MSARDLDNRVCANRRCEKAIKGKEFVMQVSTAHVRWFCNIDCVLQGQQALHDALREAVQP